MLIFRRLSACCTLDLAHPPKSSCREARESWMLLGRGTVSPWADPESSSASSCLCIGRAGGVGWVRDISPPWSGQTCPLPTEESNTGAQGWWWAGSPVGRPPCGWQCSPGGSRSRIGVVLSSDGVSCWGAEVPVAGRGAEGSRRGESGLRGSSQPASVGWRGRGRMPTMQWRHKEWRGRQLVPRKPQAPSRTSPLSSSMGCP